MAVSANVEDAHCSILQRILGVFPIVLAAQRSALTCIMWRDVHTTWLTVSWSSGQLLRSLRGVRIPKVFSTAALSAVPFENFSAKDFFSWKFVGSDTLCCIFDKVSPGGRGRNDMSPADNSSTMAKILADLRPSADGSAVRICLVASGG